MGLQTPILLSQLYGTGSMESTRLSRRFTTMSLLGASVSILVIISVAGLSYGSATTAFDGWPAGGALSPHHKAVITFSGLDTNLRTCILRGESVPIGEEVSQQFKSLGVVFASSQFALSEANRIEIVGGDSGLSGDPILAVDPTDGVNMCPLNGSENTNVTLTAVFVNPSTGAPATARNVAVHVSDGQLSVHVRTLNVMGDVIHDCSTCFLDALTWSRPLLDQGFFAIVYVESTCHSQDPVLPGCNS